MDESVTLPQLIVNGIGGGGLGRGARSGRKLDVGLQSPGRAMVSLTGLLNGGMAALLCISRLPRPVHVVAPIVATYPLSPSH